MINVRSSCFFGVLYAEAMAEMFSEESALNSWAASAQPSGRRNHDTCSLEHTFAEERCSSLLQETSFVLKGAHEAFAGIRPATTGLTRRRAENRSVEMPSHEGWSEELAWPKPISAATVHHSMLAASAHRPRQNAFQRGIGEAGTISAKDAGVRSRTAHLMQPFAPALPVAPPIRLALADKATDVLLESPMAMLCIFAVFVLSAACVCYWYWDGWRPKGTVRIAGEARAASSATSRWRLGTASSQFVRRASFARTAANTSQLCPDLVVPETSQCSLLIPRLPVDAGVADDGIPTREFTIDDARGNPIFRVVFAPRTLPRQQRDPNEGTMLPLEGIKRLVLTNLSGDFVYAYCCFVEPPVLPPPTSEDMHWGYVPISNVGKLSMHHASSGHFSTMVSNAPQPGFRMTTKTGSMLSFHGALGKLNITDSQGVLMATVERNPVARRSLDIGSGADAGLIVLCILGIDLLEWEASAQAQISQRVEVKHK